MVPASTILLAIATAIPFGLAIRDTVAGTYDEPPHDERDEDSDSDTELDTLERQAALADYARRQAEAALERQQRLQQLRDLVGRDLATPGPMFSSVHLGDPVGTSSVESSADVQVILLDDGAYSHALDIKLSRRDDCDQLEAIAHAAWGTPTSFDSLRIWVNTSQRAVWNPRDCTLTFERISSAGDLVSRSVALIGTPAKALLDQLGERMDTATDDQITWRLLGIGTGYGITLMTADIEAGKVAAVTAVLHVDPITQNELSEQITSVVGRASVIPADRPDTELWKPDRRMPRIQLVEDAPQLLLTVGSRPE